MKLGLSIDLDTCLGCNACAVACKECNTSGTLGPLPETDPNGSDPTGVSFNRIRQYEVDTSPENKTVNFLMSCMHCEDADCVGVSPTGVSYKWSEDGIVLIDQDKCMGGNLCAWMCSYFARELDAQSGTMTKCNLCIDRNCDELLPEEDRQPACVVVCPTKARLFGDFDDPECATRRGSGFGYGGVGLFYPASGQPKERLAGSDAGAYLMAVTRIGSSYSVPPYRGGIRAGDWLRCAARMGHGDWSCDRPASILVGGCTLRQCDQRVATDA